MTRSINFLKLPARMVDFHNPHTIARECSTYTFPSGSGPCSAIYRSFFSTVAVLNLVHIYNGIYMWVYLPPSRQTPGSFCVLNRDPPHLVGDSLLPLTMSGMSSEGVSPTDERYGSVSLFGFRQYSSTTEN